MAVHGVCNTHIQAKHPESSSCWNQYCVWLRHQIAHSSEKEVLAPVFHCLLLLGKQRGAAQHIAGLSFHPGNVVRAVAALLTATQTVHVVLCMLCMLCCVRDQVRTLGWRVRSGALRSSSTPAVLPAGNLVLIRAIRAGQGHTGMWHGCS